MSSTEHNGDVRLRLPGGVPALLAYVDHQQRLVYASDLVEEWFGLPAAEAAGRHLRQVLGDAAYERIGPQAGAALAGCAVTFEAALPRSQGAARNVRASFTADLAPDGGVRGFVAMMLDIDAEKAVEAELRLQQQVLASLREGVSVWSEAGTFLYANAAVETMFDHGSGELAGAPIEVLRREPRLREVAEAGGDAGWEGEFANLSRQARPFTTRARVSVIDAGGRRCWVCVEEDITERQRAGNRFRALTEAKTAFAEAGLDFAAASEVVVRRLAELIGDACAIRVLSSDGDRLEPLAVHHRDPEACALMKGLLAPEPLDGRRLVARAFESSEALLLTGLTAERLLAEVGGDAAWDDYLARFAPHSLLLAPMRVHGRPIGLLLLGRDGPDGPYTDDDRRFAEAVAGRAAVTLESVRLYEAAREASRLKDEFLSTLSHELRTPLNAIVGWAHVLRAEDLDEATRARAVAIITRNAEMQSRMIADVLDVSRIISGRLLLEIGAVDVAPLLRACLEGMAAEAAAKGLEVRAVVEEGLPTISADEDRLQQVICHLLSNAVRFAAPNGSLGVTLRSAGSGVEIVVEDDGPGIEPAFLPFVFDRFRQADSSSTRAHGGLGLGLAIVRHVVELHGGTVEARNREEGPTGAVFTVRLPRKAPAVQVARSALRGPASALGAVTPPRGTPSLTGVRVLAVDDDDASREVLGVLLGRWGAEVELAASAQEGFERLRSWSPHVMLVDIEMPGEDGYSFVRRLRQLPPERGGRIPAAALTAYASAEDRARALEAGFAAHVRKPVAPAELAAVIAELAAAGSPV